VVFPEAAVWGVVEELPVGGDLRLPPFRSTEHEITRHFTATTYVVFDKKVLLHWHSRLRMWLPPGGHIDRDELPHLAALREVKEETGLEVELLVAPVRAVGPGVARIPEPQYILLEEITPSHQHVDFIYFARALQNRLKPAIGESTTLVWYSEEDLDSQEIQPEVRWLGREAIQRIAGGS